MKSDIDYISQVAAGWVVAMAAFIVFQVADLYDSLSAQASILIILTPMTLAGLLAMAKIRIIGTALGCIAGMAVQLILGSWYGHGYSLARLYHCDGAILFVAHQGKLKRLSRFLPCLPYRFR